MPSDRQRPLPSTPKIDTTRSHSARIWDYWLGGKENYPVDRELGDQIEQILPDIVTQARINRLFLGRAVRYAAGEVGIAQFLDIGTGLPTVDNTHQVAQRVNPAARVVYVDNDPLVLAHARALLTSTPEGVTDYLDVDLYDPRSILEQAAETLDLSQPVAVTMLGVLWHVLEDETARDIIGTLMEAMPPGSLLAVTHPTLEVTGAQMADAIDQWNAYGTPEGRSRTPAEIAALFEGLELVEPGIVSCPLWRQEAEGLSEIQPSDQYCGVGRKP
ncbi:SAM-dependent methyltransferase [Actinocorallia populi]|uniref:SAM-dependent methyltransferase n=1 Tax=Actinocorallia populi TaxID=2079200 RepID=UPI001E3EA2C2|nr:SAM-dependent methyltransferase [Actinocorallia populi]